eukprot:8140666-Pyramimonas_sp.AAC.1
MVGESPGKRPARPKSLPRGATGKNYWGAKVRRTTWRQSRWRGQRAMLGADRLLSRGLASLALPRERGTGGEAS